jgi:type II secretory pathway component GspD/PulD (secretin)
MRSGEALRRGFVGLLAAAVIFATVEIPRSPGAAATAAPTDPHGTPASPSPGRVTAKVPLKNAKPDQIVPRLEHVFPRLRVSADTPASIVIEGPATDVASAKALAMLIDDDAAKIVLKNVKPDQIVPQLQKVFPKLGISADAQANIVLAGTATDVASAKALVALLDNDAAPCSSQDYPASDDPTSPLRVRVFCLDSAALGPQVAAALTSFLQQQTPQPTPPASPSQTTVNVVIPQGLGPNGPAAFGPAVVLAPSQLKVVVRADKKTLQTIGTVVLPALLEQPSPKPDAPSTQYTTYDVRYAIPNPVPSGGPLTATSTVSDLAASVNAIIGQTGPVDVKVSADPTYPRIIVAGTPSGVKNAMKMLRDLDRKPALVGIEADFYEVDATLSINAGFQLPGGAITTSIGEYSPPTTSPAGALVAASPPPLFLPQKLVHTPLSIGATLNLLHQRGFAKLLATPHAATVNGRSTVLAITNNIPFAVTNPGNSAAPPTVQNYTTGTRLEIVPIINGDGSISAYVHPSYTTLTGFTALQAPLTSQREAFTTFRIISGQAAYISGLVEVNDFDAVQKPPIPLIGNLFRNHSHQHTETQLFIVVRAYIIDPGDLVLPQLEVDPKRPPTPKPLPRAEPLETAPPYRSLLPPSPTPAPRPMYR